MTQRGDLPPEIPVETTEGRRAGGTPGDRLMVGIAAVALLGGVLIVAGKGLADDADRATDGAKNSAVGVASPSPSARPTPSPRVISVENHPLPSPREQTGPQFDGWIRTKVDLPVFSRPRLDAASIGRLKKGGFAYASWFDPAEYGIESGDGITWLRVGFEQDGFITAAKGGTKLVDQYQAMQIPQPAYVAGIGSSPDRLIMYGGRQTGDHRWTGYVATSADGSDWRLVDMGQLQDYQLQQVAHGPAGWLAMASVEDDGPPRTWLFASADGVKWQVSGSFELNPEGAQPTSLVGGPAGYLMTIERGNAAEILHSLDGVTWTGTRVTNDPPIAAGELPVPVSAVATARGFYVYTGPWGEWYRRGDERRASFGGFSPDGRTWQWHELPPGGVNLRVVAVRDGLLGIDVSQVTGQPRVWQATFHESGVGVQWVQDQVATSLLRTAGVSALASSGAEAMVFGWDRQTGEPLVFRAMIDGWRSLPLPSDAFGGMPPTAVAGQVHGTFVAVGMRHNLFGDNPVIWQRPLSGSWSAEGRPVLGYIGPPADRASCPALPSNAVAFNLLPSQWAVFCFGRAAMTFRAWVADCQDCFGGGGETGMEPAWLLDPPNRIALSPVEGNDYLMPATPAKSLTVQREWTAHWVEITGHYDDPASATCREVVDPRTGAIQPPRQVTIDNCRQQFVVTAVRVVEGPGPP